MEISIYRYLKELRSAVPLVQNITNYVVMNNTANALLAVGASPVMVHAKEELNDVVPLASAVVINIGTLSPYWIEGMLQAAELAREHKKPWVLDPVGAGISGLRNQALKRLLHLNPMVIRGNASEILALDNFGRAGGKGVDSTESSDAALNAARELNRRYGSIVCVSGEIDYIVSGDRIARVANGDPLMQKVTGLGCTSSALIGAFIGLGQNAFEEAVSGVAVTSLAGQLAAGKSDGPGTLQLHLYDCLYNLDQETLDTHLKLETDVIAS